MNKIILVYGHRGMCLVVFSEERIRVQIKKIVYDFTLHFSCFLYIRTKSVQNLKQYYFLLMRLYYGCPT